MTSSKALVRYALRCRGRACGFRISHRTELTPTWLTCVSSKPAWLTLGVLEVVPPQGTDLVLAAHVPHGEADVLVLHRLNVET